jgi:hypothetical protein
MCKHVGKISGHFTFAWFPGWRDTRMSGVTFPNFFCVSLGEANFFWPFFLNVPFFLDYVSQRRAFSFFLPSSHSALQLKS